MTYVEPDLLDAIVTNKGKSLLQLSQEKPVLCIFLRHFGCIFCLEAMKDVARQKKEIESKGVRIVFVHMADYPTADKYFNELNLTGTEHISDPNCRYYSAFGLVKGSSWQLYGLKVWIRGIETRIKDSSSNSLRQIGDGIQMPGVFYIVDGEIRDEYIHSRISDRPDYKVLISCSTE